MSKAGHDIAPRRGIRERFRAWITPGKWVVIATTANILSTGLFVVATHDSDQKAAEAAVAEITVERDTARLASCNQFNDQQAREREAERQQLRSVISPRERTPEEQEQLDAVLARHDAQVARSYPDRRCDAAGIDAYFDNDPTTDPFIPPEDP